jgi:glycosyltransferase involved in cell wall biosynthesis
MLEDLQYQAVDLRYGLSHSYLDEWRAKCDLESHYLSPWRFLRPTMPSRTRLRGEPPDLQFIGRTEKRKGPDVFVELARWLPRTSYGKAYIIGPQDWSCDRGSNHRLREMMKNRGCEGLVTLLPAANRYDLDRLFAARAVTILPSRYDTFNLVAVESLLAGCPTAVGSGAGVCRFLEESLPDVPFIKMNMQHWQECVPALRSVLDDYDRHRDCLVDAVQSIRRQPDGSTLSGIYKSEAAFVPAARAELEEWYGRSLRHLSRRASGRVGPGQTMRAFCPARSPERIGSAKRSGAVQASLATARIANRLKQRILRRLPVNSAESCHPPAAPASLLEHYNEIHHLPERSASQLGAKIWRYGELLSTTRADRIRIWRELARLESARGNALTAATYRLRAMRLTGADRFHDLPAVRSILERHGFAREAAVADAMFGAHSDGEERCRRILQDAFDSHRSPWEGRFEKIDDRRADREPCLVSVIVSLYNAADKLPNFLRALSLQTLLAAGKGEVILIDSGSPGAEYAVFRQMADDLRISIVYARSAERETIQSAWNRGIALSRGKYLSFLGVDEAILPQTLETLARELDAHPSLDWIQANSLVTNVNPQGHWVNDIMAYDRTGYRHHLPYLETCYLSWVGALYRRDIHHRYGYYDPSFGAAGDTEFKNRVLPFIKTGFLPQTLGVFWNYPSGQTTCSPRAEIEDLRAWYLHRSVAGIHYAFERRGRNSAEELLHATLRYRKSYCRHLSTDVEYALNLATFLRRREPDAQLDRMHDGLARLLATYRSLDFLPEINSHSLEWSLSRAFYVAARVAREQFELTERRTEPAYQVFNDNRYEQHANLWSNAA